MSQFATAPRMAADGGSRFPHLDGWHALWPLDDFENPQASWRAPEFGMSPRARRRTYPLRAMRYWFMAQLLRREAARLGRPLAVLEVGVDTGQMLSFLGGAAVETRNPLPACVGRWDAITLKPDVARLKRLGYGQVHDHDVHVDPLPVDGRYDAVIVLHVLEHLHDPDGCLSRMADRLSDGGVVIGGYPVVPELARAFRQWQLRNGASRHGHCSKFSPARTRRLAKAAGLDVDWLSGAFFLRSKGSILESSKLWTRLNLAFGSLFTAWPGELYFQLRKRA
jgi:SAM-dependent methyltransferase